MTIRVGDACVTRHIHPDSGKVCDALPVHVLQIARWWRRSRDIRFSNSFLPPTPASIAEIMPYEVSPELSRLALTLSTYENAAELTGRDADEVEEFKEELFRYKERCLLKFADLSAALPPLAFYAYGNESYIEWIRREEPGDLFVVPDRARWEVDPDQVIESMENALRAALGEPTALDDCSPDEVFRDFLPPVWNERAKSLPGSVRQFFSRRRLPICRPPI